jgi:hypothetical protein
VFGGVISNNTAVTGGGIGVAVVENLRGIFVSDGVTFSNNRATVAYNRASTHDSLYNSHIGSSVIWTSPFTQGYNNYDISYTSGPLFSTPTPSSSPTIPTPSKSPSTPTHSSSPVNTPTPNKDDGASSDEVRFSLRDVVTICVVVVILTCIVAFSFVIFFQKRGSKIMKKESV